MVGEPQNRLQMGQAPDAVAALQVIKQGGPVRSAKVERERLRPRLVLRQSPVGDIKARQRPFGAGRGTRRMAGPDRGGSR